MLGYMKEGNLINDYDESDYKLYNGYRVGDRVIILKATDRTLANTIGRVTNIQKSGHGNTYIHIKTETSLGGKSVDLTFDLYYAIEVGTFKKISNPNKISMSSDCNDKCNSNLDCPENYVCQDGVCVPDKSSGHIVIVDEKAQRLVTHTEMIKKSYKVGDKFTISHGGKVYYNAEISDIDNYIKLIQFRYDYKIGNNITTLVFSLKEEDFLKQISRVEQYKEEVKKKELVPGVDTIIYDERDLVPMITAYGYKIPKTKKRKNGKRRGTSDTGPK
jgi:hypothetical protein